MADPTPADEGTAAAILKQAIAGDRSLVEVAEGISNQALLRMACEVRQVSDRQPRFTATSVLRVDVTPRGRLRFVLDGSSDDAYVASEDYFKRCGDQPTYRGFAVVVLTANEDHVHSLAVPPLVLLHRLSLFRPTDLRDFELVCLMMYLENCPRSHATPSLFVKVSAWLGVVARHASPFERVRCLLLRSCHWILNTLMCMAGVKPFDDELVLPHWYMAHYLLANNPPPVLSALFCATPQSSALQLPGPVPRTDCVAYNPAGVMGSCWNSKDLRSALVYWWLSGSPKRRTSSLFYRFC